MPVHMNLHIFVDRNGKAKVTSQVISGGTVPTNRLDPGDKVTFTSNDKTTEIRFMNDQDSLPPRGRAGSPFGAQLRPKKTHNVADGALKGTVFTVRTACNVDNPFVFECGHEVGGDFSPWGTLEGDTPGGGVPTPDQ
jgi:selenocysteine-specific translation elongation factor